MKTRSIKMRDTKGHTLYDSIYIKMSRLGKSIGEHHYWRTGTKRARCVQGAEGCICMVSLRVRYDTYERKQYDEYTLNILKHTH